MSADKARDCWDADYRKKGSLYGGTPRRLPPLPAGARVLELGCGNGKSLSGMVHRGWTVTAIDFSIPAALLARAPARQGSGAGIVVADARALPFREGSFDAVASCHLLGHALHKDRLQIAREISRVLSPEGQVWFCDFSTRDFRYGSGREQEPGTFIRGNGILTHYFTEAETMDLFPGFVTESLRHDEWVLRVRGKRYPRSEISALFRRDIPLL